MSKFTKDTKSFFSNTKKRRTVMFVLLVVLIILLLLLISRCTYDISHGFSDVTDNYIGAEGWGDDSGDTTEPGGDPSDTTDPSGGDTTEPSGGDDTSDPEDTTADPADTTGGGNGGSSPIRPSASDSQIKLRPLNSTDKVEFHTTGTIPGQKEEIFIEVVSHYAKDRKLTFELDVTKDKTNWVNTELADVLILTLEVTNGSNTFTKQGTFKELDGVVIDLGTLRAHYMVQCNISVVLDTSAGNEYINSLLEADFIWQAE